ncbi:hypothetical protein ABZ490_38450 [Streptomyces sp. NPDC005811]|uniref:hypothetical protein n=1 Tax=Streptomyces sp. NPDC005811 TaxID=3154565 RepID=UPI0033C9B76B
MSEILSYLAAALPSEVSAEARLLALQCALRMNAQMRVTLPAGVPHSLSVGAAQACRELEQARWLRLDAPPGAAGTAAQLLDAALLAQPPARPDRRRAADWALRTGCPARIGMAEPRMQLLGTSLVAHSDPSSGDGVRESDRVLRDCGLPERELAHGLDRLAGSGVLEMWQICPHSGDVHWTLERSR